MKFHQQPKCDECGKFIPWKRAIFSQVLRYDMQHEPYLDDEVGGFCEECEARVSADLAHQNAQVVS